MSHRSSEFGGLPALPGIRFAFYPSLRRVICPLCKNPDVALLAGDVAFTAKMDGSELNNREQKLAAFVCSQSHMFFLLEKDIVSFQGPEQAA
ncbi:MAG: hypothetical protein ACRD4I_10835 [Candidatus Angelobacter sp.]